MNLFDKIEKNMPLSRDDLKEILLLEDKNDLEHLYGEAYRVKTETVGRQVYLRGLIEVSNICSKNCFYCGIRRDNTHVHRYIMDDDDIIEGAKTAARLSFGSIVLQAGEVQSNAFTSKIEQLLIKIHEATGHSLGITLSLGEQPLDVYQRWFDAGAKRYLLRIEASNRELYKKLHPADHSWDKRFECLQLLKQTGYQTGTGTMSGLPFQTADDLVSDLIFFKENNIDMIGMGPYLPHEDTPLAQFFGNFKEKRKPQLERALKMIAAARIYLRDVNIASTTALQVLAPDGRERGLLAGANVIMPNVSLAKYKGDYNLYEGKPGLDDGPEQAITKLKNAVEAIGETIAFGIHGDPKHYFSRTGK